MSSPVTRAEERAKNFAESLRHAINCANAESGSNTPDFVLAEFLVGCLAAFDKAVTSREKLTVAPQPLGTFTPDAPAQAVYFAYDRGHRDVYEPAAVEIEQMPDGTLRMVHEWHGESARREIARREANRPQPPADEPAGVVTTALDKRLRIGPLHMSELLKLGHRNTWLMEGEVKLAHREDQRAACKPLLERIAALEAELAEAKRRSSDAWDEVVVRRGDAVEIADFLLSNFDAELEGERGHHKSMVIRVLRMLKEKAEANAKAAKDLARLRWISAKASITESERIERKCLLTKAGG